MFATTPDYLTTLGIMIQLYPNVMLANFYRLFAKAVQDQVTPELVVLRWHKSISDAKRMYPLSENQEATLIQLFPTYIGAIYKSNPDFVNAVIDMFETYIPPTE